MSINRRKRRAPEEHEIIVPFTQRQLDAIAPIEENDGFAELILQCDTYRANPDAIPTAYILPSIITLEEHLRDTLGGEFVTVDEE